MELFLILVGIAALVYLTYRAMLNTKDLSETKIEPPTPVAPILTQQAPIVEETPAKKPRKSRAKKSAE